MPDSALVTVLTSAGVAGVFCVLFILGMVYPKSVVDDLRAERDALRAQIEAERDRADAAVAAAQAARDVMSALQAGVAMGRHHQGEQGSAVMPDPRAAGEGGVT